MKRLILFIIALVGLASMQSCQYDWYEPVEPDIPEVVSYSEYIQPIWDKGCNGSGCHGNGGFSPNLIAGKSYDAIMSEGLVNLASPESSILYTKCIPGGSMNQFTQPGDTDYILAWIQQGAQNN
jgi:hypothetical protein